MYGIITQSYKQKIKKFQNKNKTKKKDLHSHSTVFLFENYAATIILACFVWYVLYFSFQTSKL